MPARVVVTGVGVVSPAGAGLPALVDAVARGLDLRRPVPWMATDGLRAESAALCEDPGPGTVPSGCLADRIAAVALGEALASVPVGVRDGMTLYLGGGSAWLREAEAEYLSDRPDRRTDGAARLFVDRPPGTSPAALAGALGLGGGTRSVATACSSGLNAVGAAFRDVRAGRVAAAVAGGVEVLGRLTSIGFNALGVLSPDRPRPFDARRGGIALGEGAAFLVLERDESAAERGAVPWGAVLGWACCAEAWHPAQPEPSGAHAARVMGLALADAGRGPRDVAWVKAHGNATRPSDLAEARGVRALLGERTPEVPVTSMKGVLGHTLGASGAIEAAAALVFLGRREIPPTWGLSEPDPECEVDPIVPPSGRPLGPGFAVVNAFAFGGNDAALVLAGPQ